MIVLKNIEMTLDPESIERAIREVEDFKKYLHEGMVQLIDHLTEKGVKIAKAQLLSFNPPAFYTRQLYETIQQTYYDASTQEGTVYVGEETEYAIYVEYGTGIYGADIHHHGDAGWWYLNDRDGEWHWTNGMPPRPFMHNTVKLLSDYAETNGARIIAQYIP